MAVWNRRPLSELRIPRSLHDAVRQRTEQLSEPASKVLRLAAITGRRFDFTLLQQLTGHDEQPLLALIKELIAAQLIVEESEEQFAFRHALTREAIYTELLVRERKALHRIVAETMKRIYASALDAHLAELAYHFYYEQAITLFRRLDDRLGLTSSLASLTLRGPVYVTNTLVSATANLAELVPDVEMALKMARGIGQRSGEAYALYQLGQCLGSQGDYMRAWDALHRSLAIAEEIGQSSMDGGCALGIRGNVSRTALRANGAAAFKASPGISARN